MAAICTLLFQGRGVTAVVLASTVLIQCSTDAAGRSPFAPSGIAPTPDDTYAFRLSLESMYREQLHRPLTSSFVDLESGVVWLQEYLRYRVDGCSHELATTYVIAQVGGSAGPQACGAPDEQFPPRDESLDFMQRLEAKYQQDPGRVPTKTHVDLVGNVVWTQEYLRYRSMGCSYDEARWNVAVQIFGGTAADSCGGNATATRRRHEAAVSR
jgi:hypothetical protein